ncbi:SNF2 helicase associated domain-containing protein [Paenibacillus sp. IB182496]|uniref:SNF2 helicase associated domain-containing protein n=1 Tax=Paenibacillus sabuli TaxID=2772509 RepID=A0A927GTZ7_9BACL|nr:DEAD/DEAH box helicase [Paenibacillus sabuli]MBD2848148.1 SNF2 helicase associated domain-containing protein [Paenibacillus sabuli]
MNITIEDIKEMCGSTSYSRGRQYQQAGRVKLLPFNAREQAFKAAVRGSRTYTVAVWVEDNEVREVECNCPAFSNHYYCCKHVAAVLLEMRQATRQGPANVVNSPSGRTFGQALSDWESRVSNRTILPDAASLAARFEEQLAQRMLDLFEDSYSPGTDRAISLEKEVARAEFTIHIGAVPDLLQVELKIGAGRLYVVHKIREFLEQMDHGQPIVFTKNYTYDPRHQTFSEADTNALNALVAAMRDEKYYYAQLQQSAGYWGSHSGSGKPKDGKTMLLPSRSWDALLPLLRNHSITYKIVVRGVDQGAVPVTEQPPALSFELKRGKDKTAYNVHLKELLTYELLPSYGLATGLDEPLHAMDKASVRKLAELKTLALQGERGVLIVPSTKTEAFMHKVAPSLRHLGQLKLDRQLTVQVIDEPLRARVHLDRTGQRLEARVQFHYGAIAYTPQGRLVEGTSAEASRGSGSETAPAADAGHTVIRDPVREEQVKTLLLQSGFQENGERYMLEGDEAEYHFLYNCLAHLEQVAEVYATSSVEATRVQRTPAPRVKLELDNKRNWLDVSFQMDGIDTRELTRLLRSLMEKKKYYRLSSGALISLEGEDFDEVGRLFEELGLERKEVKGGGVKLPAVRGLSLQAQDEQSKGAVRVGKTLRRLLDDLRHPDNLDFELPSTLTPVLRDYQTQGFQWFKMLSHYGLGGILADDMGLGKTLQSIAYLLSERERSDWSGTPMLIVCPASLVYNWRNELQRFAPELAVAVAAGGKAERDAVLEQAMDRDVIITSYPLARRDQEWYAARTFHALILDEAQAIKNDATQTAQAVKSIDAVHRFALTGTPIENRLEELWSIYDAVFPGLFPSRTAFGQLKPEQVARKIRPFLLRRLKRDVLTELPDKIEALQVSELHEEQKKLYMAYLMQLKSETADQLAAEGFQKSRMKILAGLTRLRQICCHPSLFLEDYAGGSAKLEQLLEVLEECLASGRRVLIFSQFTSMLALIRETFAQRGWPCLYLDGSTKPAERVELCERFNAGGEGDLFLISLKAGGTGLNLTGADTVILYDLWWNPAVEQQAADRAHRIGQQQVVQVFRFVTEGTIEEKMYELQQRKKDLVDTVVTAGEQGTSSLSEADIRELLSL